MILTGTLKERIAQAVEFAKAHRDYEYDHEMFVERYRKAGVPYTEAVEKFCREWDGVLNYCRFCGMNKSARAHGGFERCRLFPYNSGLNVIDLSEVIGNPQDPDWDALPAHLSKYLTEYYDQVKYPGRTLLPDRIIFVEE